MVILMVGVLLIAGLLCVHIGSGGLRRLSSLMFAQANKYENVDTNGLGVLNNAGGHSLQPELVDLMDDGIDIVRIKTTEEVSFFVLFALPSLLPGLQNVPELSRRHLSSRRQAKQPAQAVLVLPPKRRFCQHTAVVASLRPFQFWLMNDVT